MVEISNFGHSVLSKRDTKLSSLCGGVSICCVSTTYLSTIIPQDPHPSELRALRPPPPSDLTPTPTEAQASNLALVPTSLEPPVPSELASQPSPQLLQATASAPTTKSSKPARPTSSKPTPSPLEAKSLAFSDLELALDLNLDSLTYRQWTV